VPTTSRGLKVRLGIRRLTLLVAFLAGCAQADKVSHGGDLSMVPDLTPDKLGFWMECTTDDQCESGYCYRAMSGDLTGHCTLPCMRLCPDGFECKTVRLDNQFEADLCVPAQDTMCKRCSTHRDCGDSNDLCIDIGGGRFCSIDCRGNPGVCPPGFACVNLGVV